MANTDIVQVIAEARADARSLSEFVFKPADFMVQRRLAPPINTLEYYLNHFRNVISAAQASANTAINNIIIDGNAQISNAISNAGFVQVGTFAVGATLAKRNDVIQASDGKLYRWGGSLPKTVAASSTPENSGGFGANTWVEVSDASLSQKLAGLGGASTIGSGVSVFNNMAEFLAVESKIKDGSKVFLASIYQGLDLEGEGRLYTYSKSAPRDIKQPTTSGFLSRDFDGKVFIAEYGATGDDYDKDSAALAAAFTVIRSAPSGGILSMGTKCKYKIEGQIAANCSNLDWQFNGSEVILGRTWLRWHPYKLGRASYTNVKISDAVWRGNTKISEGIPANIHMDFAKAEGLEIRGCTYIEAIHGGHFMDLLGCRDVYFEDNHVLGSCIYTRVFTEAVQLGAANWTDAGSHVEEESKQYWDGLPTSHVYFRRNVFKPYANPVTAITTYPPRPIGDHNFSNAQNIHIEHNTFDDIFSLMGETNPYRIALLTLTGTNNIFINDNDIFIKDSLNTRAIYMHLISSAAPNDIGIRPNFSIDNNTIDIKMAEGTTITGTAIAPIVVRYESVATNRLGANISIKGNDINANVNVTNSFFGAAISLTTGYADNDLIVDNNTINLVGGFSHHIVIYGTSGEGGATRTGTEKYTSNTLSGLLKLQSINIPSSRDGVDLIIADNTFVKQWRTIYAASPKSLTLSGNKLMGFSLKSFNGIENGTTDADGRASTINVYGGNVYAINNVLIGETRATPIRINGSTVTVQPEYKFMLAPIT